MQEIAKEALFLFIKKNESFGAKESRYVQGQVVKCPIKLILD